MSQAKNFVPTLAQQTVLTDMANEGAFIASRYGKIKLKFPGRPPHPDGRLQHREIAPITYKVLREAQRIKQVDEPPTLKREHPDYETYVWVHAKPGELEAEFNAKLDAVYARLVAGDSVRWVNPHIGSTWEDGTQLDGKMIDKLVAQKRARREVDRWVATTPEAEAAKEKAEADQKKSNRNKRFAQWRVLLLRAYKLPVHHSYVNSEVDEALEQIANEARDCMGRDYDDEPRKDD